MSQRARPGSATTTSVDPAERAREIALRLLTNSARSEASLREGLVSRDVDPAIADQLIVRYREVGLLDDPALAATIARTRHRERGVARRAIEQELRRKGFAAPDIDVALEQVSSEDEWEAAHRLAVKRWNSLDGLDEHVRVRRVIGMLGRKGYSLDLACGVVKQLQRADTADT
jgi:regulatory protein